MSNLNTISIDTKNRRFIIAFVSVLILSNSSQCSSSNSKGEH